MLEFAESVQDEGMGTKSGKVIATALASAWGVIALASQVRLDAAASNISASLHQMGIDIPKLIWGFPAHLVMLMGGLVGSLVLLGIAFWPDQARKIANPKNKWLKLCDAPFDLAPRQEYIALATEWTPAFIEGSLPGAELHGITFSESLSKANAATIDGIPLSNARIEWENRRFALSWSGGGHYRGCTLRPWPSKEHGKPEYISEQTWSAVLHQLNLTWGLLHRGLSSLISSGHVRVWARTGSATAPFFTVLSPDAWAHYSVADWPTGRATGEGGEPLFSIHIEPRVRTKRARLDWRKFMKRGSARLKAKSQK